jgi:hypothetical protein
MKCLNFSSLVDGLLYFRPRWLWYGGVWYHGASFTLVIGDHGLKFYDELGLRIPRWRVLETYSSIPKPAKSSRRFKYRDGPVEGIRCIRGGWGWYRRPRTHQQNSVKSALRRDEEMLEYGIVERAKRRRLPTDWDDIRRYDRRDRSWKRHRERQYR